MHSKHISRKAREHLMKVKGCACSVCDAPAPSSAHHIRQGDHFTTVALCYECHQGVMGWHGTKALWRIRKMDELSALNVTLERISHD
jgi:hypothetical protein